MEKRTSDEIWLLNQKGIMSIAAKNDVLASGSGIGHMMVWHWPLIQRTSRKQKGIFEYGRPSFGQPQQTKTLELQLPRMRDSFIVTEDQEEFINAIDIADDKIAVASGDYRARIFDLKSRNLFACFDAFKPMHSVAISDKYCAYSSRDGCGIVSLPSLATIDADQDFYGKYYLRNLAIKDEWLMGGSFEGITVFEIKSGELIYNLNTEIDKRMVGSFQQLFSVDRNHLAGNGAGNEISVWNLKSGEKIAQFKGPSGYLIDVSIENNLIGAANMEGTAFIWDLDSRNKIAEIQSSLGYCNRLIIDKNKVGMASYVLEIWNF
ncbi:MAG: WD40 repeat domain-containing protein [Promethearchaeota archaeon]